MATLLGGKEVPPVDTQATGTAGFNQPHFDTMTYGLQVSNMSNVSARHTFIKVKKEKTDQWS